MIRRHPGLVVGPLLGLLMLWACSAVPGADAGEGRDGRRPPKRPDESVFLTDVPAHAGSMILGRPTATSVTVTVLWHADTEAVLVWGTDPEKLPAEGGRIRLAAGEPQRVVIQGLVPDTRYACALLDPSTGRRLLPSDRVGSFHTARPPGQAFTFTLQADPHLDGQCSPALYRRTLANVLADTPDFHIDLGDTFMTEKHSSRDSAARQYAAQHYYLGLVGQSAPLFLVLGNHDGEGLDRSGHAPADGLAVWAHGMRTRYFANPVPDDFYSGNTVRHPAAGLLENYYAWEWGDALFVVLDPYWSSLPTRGGRSPWNMTLGAAQHEWLTRTLRSSRARFKFLFIHQLTGSYHESGRGGAEAAAYHEWGGRELDGREAFAAHRPGWGVPIHRLLVETGVTAVFHGHDHFYAQQELDGIVYQLVPQPGHRNDRTHQAAEYGYREGVFLPASGHLRVRVTPEHATVEYIRAVLPESEARGVRNRTVSASYQLSPRGRAPEGPRVSGGQPSAPAGREAR
jgi:hypothetical protein